MLDREEQLRGEMAQISRALHVQGLVAGTDGNVSVRLSPDRFLITPSGRGLGALGPDDMILLDAEGNKRSGAYRPSSESKIHLAAMEERLDIGAVIHAHPPAATAFAMVGESLPGDCHPEMAAWEGEVPLVPYATPGSPELAEALRPRFALHNAFLLANHGLLCMGNDLWDSLWRLERIEQFARSYLMARGLGSVRSLPPGETDRLRGRSRRGRTLPR